MPHVAPRPERLRRVTGVLGTRIDTHEGEMPVSERHGDGVWKRNILSLLCPSVNHLIQHPKVWIDGWRPRKTSRSSNSVQIKRRRPMILD